MLITLHVFAASITRSICRESKAGIWMMSSTDDAFSTSLIEWTSEVIGILHFSLILFRMRRPLSKPTPRKKLVGEIIRFLSN